ncbi:MAG: hypothetical protein IKZ07_06965 [Akkermansia sp.]|nr:hypothetical protein [Akkermansia sp.]
MFNLSIKKIILVATAAFAMGLLSPYLVQWMEETPMAAPPIEPEQDKAPIASNEFTLRLLKAATIAKPKGNITLAPDSLASVLQLMVPLSTTEVEQAIKKLQLPTEQQKSSAYHSAAAYLFADSAAPLTPELAQMYVYDVPITHDPARAFSEINLRLQAAFGKDIGTPANGETINENTHLLAINGINITPQWHIAVSAEDTKARPFFNANGSMPQVRCMSMYSERYAECPQGSWKAAAIRLHRSPRAMPETPDCYLIIIQPTGTSSAHPMAAAMTAEQFSAIRTSLRESTRSCTTLLPRLNFATAPQDIIPLLKALEIDPLFTSAAPFEKLTQASPWAFNSAAQFCYINMQESTQAAVNSRPAPPTELNFDCNRPFIWFLMPLSSPHAPFAMGVVENL